MNTEVVISWAQYDKDIHKLAEGIKTSGKEFHCIYSVPRGGLIIGVHLSHILGIAYTTKPYGNMLIADDVSDTGHTLSEWRNKRLSRASIATLYTKTDTTTVPDFWVANYPKDNWLIFPWEV